MYQTQAARSIALAALALTLPMEVLADINQTTTLTATQSLNLDTGATASSGGDLLWNGTSLVPQGAAKAAVLPGVSFAAINQIVLGGLLPALGSSAAIPSGSLPTGTVVGVLTNNSHLAKLLVTAISGSSITLQFTTYGATGGGGGGPTITQVLNNSSSIPSGFPNSGIAPSSLFVVKGSGLADPGVPVLQDSQAPGGLPLTLNGASITVVVNNVTTHPALYYTSPAQLAAVLPAATPVGTGTLTVTYKGVPSNAFTIKVVTAAPGITTIFNGTAVTQDVTRIGNADVGLITFTKSGVPGNGIIIWGTGLGADPLDSDTSYNPNAHQTTLPYTVYIGGISATIGYQGASVYPGVSVFGVYIPQNVPTGCYVPIAIVTGNVVSNIATLPIHAGGGVCSDPQYGITGDQISTLIGQTTIRSGGVSVIQETVPGAGGAATTLSVAGGSFFSVTGASYTGAGGSGGSVSIGGCVVTQTGAGQAGNGGGGSATGLDAGTITVTPPGGGPVTLTTPAGFTGIYTANLASIPATGGAFVFHATGGSGANAVGAFTVAVNFPNPIMTWTNQIDAATVARGQGLLVKWDGGAAGSYVIILGSSSDTNAGVNGSYYCLVPAETKQFTVPSYVLLSLPAGTGSTTVDNSTNPALFAASGLDYAGATGVVLISVASNYN